jgi:hypothetical protein
VANQEAVAVRILREAASPGALYVIVVLDGIDIGHLAKGKSISIRVMPGAHHIRLRYWKMASKPGEGSTSITVTAGTDVDLVVTSQKGVFKDKIFVRQQRWHDQIVTNSPAVRASIVPQVNCSVSTGGLSEEGFGSNSFVIDHTLSAASGTETIHVEKEWTRVVSFGADETVTRGIALRAGVSWVSIEGSLERAVTQRFNIELGERQKVSQQLTIHVPAYTKTTVLIKWKRVWQDGTVHVSGTRGHVADVPFRYVSHLIFDAITS